MDITIRNPYLHQALRELPFYLLVLLPSRRAEVLPEKGFPPVFVVRHWV